MATEIVAGLFLGTREDAEKLGPVVPDDWTCISVTEYRAAWGRKEELPNEPQGSIDRPFIKNNFADPVILDHIVDNLIEPKRAAGKKVLVHCVYAHERSPLVIAWYLVRFGYSATIEGAYERIEELHPSVERRIKWLQGSRPIKRWK